jgi:tetratricopeptide (TPR) repeat protein
MERAERAFVVFVLLASISPAAEPPESPCQAAPSSRECAVMTNNLGSIDFSAGRYGEAELQFARAISIWTAETEPSEDLAKALHNLGAVYRAEARYSDAVSLYESALDLREVLAGPSDITLVPTLNELGLIYLELADSVRAERTLEHARTIVHTYEAEQTAAGADAMNNLALAYRQQGRLADAAELYRRALLVYQHISDQGREVAVLNNLGRALAEQGQNKEAEELFRRAIDEAQRHLGTPTNPDVAIGFSNLGKLMIEKGKYSDAAALLRRAEQIDRQNFASGHPRIGFDLANEGAAAAGRKRYRVAEEFYKESDEILEKTLPPHHPEIGNILAHLADVYRVQGRLDESETLYRRALKILEQAWGPENPELLGPLRSYEALLRTRQEYAEAESVEVHRTKIRVVEALRNTN